MKVLFLDIDGVINTENKRNEITANNDGIEEYEYRKLESLLKRKNNV